MFPFVLENKKTKPFPEPAYSMSYCEKSKSVPKPQEGLISSENFTSSFNSGTAKSTRSWPKFCVKFGCMVKFCGWEIGIDKNLLKLSVFV